LDRRRRRDATAKASDTNCRESTIGAYGSAAARGMTVLHTPIQDFSHTNAKDGPTTAGPAAILLTAKCGFSGKSRERSAPTARSPESVAQPVRMVDINLAVSFRQMIRKNCGGVAVPQQDQPGHTTWQLAAPPWIPPTSSQMMQAIRIGLALDEIRGRFEVGCRTAQRMRNAVARIFPNLIAEINEERRRRRRIPVGKRSRSGARKQKTH